MAIDFTFEKPKKFKFALSCKDLDQVLGRVGAVMGASSSQTKNYFLIAKGKKMCVLAYNQDTFCACIVPNAVPESEGAFGVVPTDLQGIIKNRAEMEFEFNGSELHYKVIKGKYAGHIVTLPITTDQISHIGSQFAASAKKTDGKSMLSRATLDTLKEGMMLTSVKDVYTQTDLVSYILFDGKAIHVSAFDQHHFAMYRKPLKKDEAMEFRVALPINHFNVIDKMVDSEGKDKDTKFILRPEAIRVEGSSFLLSLPATQEKEDNFELVSKFLKAHKDMPYSMVYVHKALATLVDNLFTLNAVNTSFEIALKKNLLTFTFVTPRGQASDSLKVTREDQTAKDAKVNIDPALLRDLVNLAKGQEDTRLSIKPGNILLLESKSKSGGKLVLASALVR